MQSASQILISATPGISSKPRANLRTGREVSAQAAKARSAQGEARAAFYSALVVRRAHANMRLSRRTREAPDLGLPVDSSNDRLKPAHIVGHTCVLFRAGKHLQPMRDPFGCPLQTTMNQQ